MEQHYPSIPSREVWEPIRQSRLKLMGIPIDQVPTLTVCGDAADPAESHLTTGNMPASVSPQYTVDCVLSVSTLLHEHFNLPAEIIFIILDHAAYWVCTTTTKHVTSGTRSLMGRYHKLITTSPLGHDVASSLSENEQPKTPLRGQFPCRRIVVTVRAQAAQRPKEYQSPFSHMTPGGWQHKPPGKNPVIISVLWASHHANTERSPQGKCRDQIFSASNVQSVLTIYGKEWSQNKSTPKDWSVPVVEEALSPEEMEEKEVVWDWTDNSAGGDLIRALVAGDALQLAANHRAFGWGTRFSFLQVKVFHAI